MLVSWRVSLTYFISKYLERGWFDVICVENNLPFRMPLYNWGRPPPHHHKWPASWTFTFAKLQTSGGLLGAGAKNDGIYIKSDLSILPIRWSNMIESMALAYLLTLMVEFCGQCRLEYIKAIDPIWVGKSSKRFWPHSRSSLEPQTLGVQRIHSCQINVTIGSWFASTSGIWR